MTRRPASRAARIFSAHAANQLAIRLRSKRAAARRDRAECRRRASGSAARPAERPSAGSDPEVQQPAFISGRIHQGSPKMKSTSPIASRKSGITTSAPTSSSRWRFHGSTRPEPLCGFVAGDRHGQSADLLRVLDLHVAIAEREQLLARRCRSRAGSARSPISWRTAGSRLGPRKCAGRNSGRHRAAPPRGWTSASSVPLAR